MEVKEGFLLMLAVLAVTSQDIQSENELVRTKRAFEKVWGFFQTVREVKGLYDEQYNNTLSSLNEVYDLLRNSFSDTATTTPPPVSLPNATERSTTESYKISRYDFGKILGRNYRGLKKLYRLEMDDARNATQANIKQYQAEVKNALASFATFD